MSNMIQAVKAVHTRGMSKHFIKHNGEWVPKDSDLGIVAMEKRAKADKFESFIPRPERIGPKRRMVAIDPESYDSITAIAKEMDTTRGRIIGAMVKFYKSQH